MEEGFGMGSYLSEASLKENLSAKIRKVFFGFSERIICQSVPILQPQDGDLIT